MKLAGLFEKSKNFKKQTSFQGTCPSFAQFLSLIFYSLFCLLTIINLKKCQSLKGEINIKMRLFIALPVPEQEKDELVQFQHELKENDIQYRRIPKANFHITLAFLGECSADQARDVLKIISSLPFDPVLLKSKPVDKFYSQVVVPMKLPDSLRVYVSALRMALDYEGIPVDRSKKFVPHITLFRSNKKIGFNPPDLNPNLEFMVYQPILYLSTRTENGMVYTPLTESDLDNKPLYQAQGSIIEGDVHFGRNCSLWYNAVIRADEEPIRLGDDVNVQDGCILHVDEHFSVQIGNGVTIGHNAVVHGATIGDNSLIGMNATILTGAKIGKNCLIAAGALIPEGMVVPDGMMAVGVPAKVRRALSEEEIEANRSNALHYVNLAKKKLS